MDALGTYPAKLDLDLSTSDPKRSLECLYRVLLLALAMSGGRGWLHARHVSKLALRK